MICILTLNLTYIMDIMYDLSANPFCIFRYMQEIEALSVTVISDRACVPNTKI